MVTPVRPRGWAACAVLVLGVLILGGAALSAGAQGASRTFPETGHTVSGLFWTYWQAHGGLAQQGYPISEPFQEQSDLNGQIYTVQYFERAVFEMHPENQAPFNVLLSQLGTARYKARYPGGAPAQTVDRTAGRLFPETGHWVGSKFWAYWQAHGGLAQQGFPLSDEFIETSTLNGKAYLVQYFERAVFELHPENTPPYDVLLSQLGTYQLQAKYPAGAPTAVAGATPISTPGAVPAAARALLVQSDGAMNALTSMKAHSVGTTTDPSGAVSTDLADYQYQAPDRQYIKVISPRAGQPTAVAEVIRIGTQRYQRTGGAGAWTASTDATAYHWPEYNKVYVADHSSQTVLESPATVRGVAVQVVRVTVPVTTNPAQVDQYIEYFIAPADGRVLREVTTVPALPPGRPSSGVYTSDFSDFNVPNGIQPPPSSP